MKLTKQEKREQKRENNRKMIVQNRSIFVIQEIKRKKFDKLVH
jgi:hypothetical protein